MAVKPDVFRPLGDPDAPEVACPECEDGTTACAECDGTGRLMAQYGWTVREWPCEAEGCRYGRVKCSVCEGMGSFPDPEACAECTCGGYIDADTRQCCECGRPYDAAKEVAAC